MSLTETEFLTPASMVPYWEKIWTGGEYDIRTTKPIKRILDIGACVGAFALWAHERWPDAGITCLEPNAVAFSMLRQNVPFADCRECGASDQTGHASLTVPHDNIGAAVASEVGAGDPSATCVLVDAAELPDCDLMKLDCEGYELRILSRYLFHNPKRKPPHAVVLEYHSPTLRDRIMQNMADLSYSLVRAEEYGPKYETGIQWYRMER